MVEALAHPTLQTIDAWRLAVVGTVEPATQSSIRGALGPEKVSFVNNIDEKALQEEYSQSFLLLAPYFHEGFGLPIAEGLHFALPSIISEDAALAEVAGHACRRVPAEDLESLRRILQELLERPPERASLAQLAWERRRLFTWAQTAEQTRKAFLEALAG